LNSAKENALLIIEVLPACDIVYEKYT
jgi:hypothetical protein